MTSYPHHFSARRVAGDDHIELDGWNEYGTHECTVSLTHATAADLVAVVAKVLADNPYAR